MKDRGLQVLIKIAEKQGWDIVIRRNTHLKWVAPNGFVYFSCSTPSDNRALKNIKSDLARAGLRLDKIT